MNKEKLLKNINQLCQDNDISENELINIIKKDKETKGEKLLKEKVENNKKYVGKCYRELVKVGMFPQMYRYYKVISERSLYKDFVSCLIFDEFPYYWFNYKSHLYHQKGDYFLGEFDFTPIWIDSIALISLKNLEKIDLDDYEYTFHRMMYAIDDMPWVADHYRFGGKLPFDKDWAATASSE
jgi:hypothetical protein